MSGRISIHQFVALTSTNPARLYGLYPRKGTIAIGSDADLVIWNSTDRHTIRNTGLHHAVDHTPYEGITLRAWPAMTLLRGRVVWDGERFLGRRGDGSFLRCELPEAAKPRPRHRSWRRWVELDGDEAA
jgi:dihydropyrimidinase